MSIDETVEHHCDLNNFAPQSGTGGRVLRQPVRYFVQRVIETRSAVVYRLREILHDFLERIHFYPFTTRLTDSHLSLSINCLRFVFSCPIFSLHSLSAVLTFFAASVYAPT